METEQPDPQLVVPLDPPSPLPSEKLLRFGMRLFFIPTIIAAVLLGFLFFLSFGEWPIPAQPLPPLVPLTVFFTVLVLTLLGGGLSLLLMLTFEWGLRYYYEEVPQGKILAVNLHYDSFGIKYYVVDVEGYTRMKELRTYSHLVKGDNLPRHYKPDEYVTIS